jgi:hypothetical protein
MDTAGYTLPYVARSSNHDTALVGATGQRVAACARTMWFEGVPQRNPFRKGIRQFVDRESSDNRRSLANNLWRS